MGWVRNQECFFEEVCTLVKLREEHLLLSAKSFCQGKEAALRVSSNFWSFRFVFAAEYLIMPLDVAGLEGLHRDGISLGLVRGFRSFWPGRVSCLLYRRGCLGRLLWKLRLVNRASPKNHAVRMPTLQNRPPTHFFPALFGGWHTSAGMRSACPPFLKHPELFPFGSD